MDKQLWFYGVLLTIQLVGILSFIISQGFDSLQVSSSKNVRKPLIFLLLVAFLTIAMFYYINIPPAIFLAYTLLIFVVNNYIRSIVSQPIKLLFIGVDILLIGLIIGAGLSALVQLNWILCLFVVFLLWVLGYVKRINTKQLAEWEKYFLTIASLVTLFQLSEPLIQKTIQNTKPVPTIEFSSFLNSSTVIITGLFLLLLAMGYFKSQSKIKNL